MSSLHIVDINLWDIWFANIFPYCIGQGVIFIGRLFTLLVLSFDAQSQSAFWILYFWKEWTMTTKFACFFSLGFQSLDTKHARKMWSVSLVSAGLAEEGAAGCHNMLRKTDLCSWASWTHLFLKERPHRRSQRLFGSTFIPAFVALFVTSVFFNQSWILKGISPCLLKQNALEGSRMWISPAVQPLCWTIELLVPCWWTGGILFLSWLLCKEHKFLNLVIWRYIM